MLEQKSYKIGETEYVLQQFPATRGLEIGIQLVKIAMGAAKGISDIEGDQDFLDASYNPPKMAAGIMEQIDARETPAFIKTIVRESLISPDPGESFSDWYEKQFSANIDELSELLTAIIEHNRYIDFIKKKVGAVIGIYSPSSGKDQDSSHSSRDQS